MHPGHLSPATTSAECEPLWQTVLGCLLVAAFYGLVMVLL
jgi:hypothetical protein